MTSIKDSDVGVTLGIGQFWAPGIIVNYSGIIVNYSVDLFINKLKTKFNNLFLQNDFKYEKLTTPFEEISPQELNKCLQKFNLSIP